MPWTPDASRPVSSAAPLVRALRRRLGLGEAAVAERDRRAVVLGDVEHERLRRLLARSRAARRPPAGRCRRRTSADERRHAPGHRLGADLGVAQLLGRGPRPRSASRGSPRASSSARPVGAHQHGGEAGAIVAAARAIATALVRTTAPRSWSPWKSQRTGEARRAVRRAARSSPRRARRPPPRAARPRPDRRCPGASTRPRSRSRRARAAPRPPSSRGDRRRGRVNASSASSALPARWLAVPSSSSSLRTRRPGRRSRGRAPCAGALRASSNASAPMRRPGRQEVVVDAALRSAERRGGGEVVGEVGEGAAENGRRQLSSASPTREVKLRPPQPAEPVVEGPAHELVRESIGEPASGTAPRSSRCGRPRRARRAARPRASRGGRADDVELELRSGGRRRARADRWSSATRRESRWLTTSRTLSGVPSSLSGRVEPDRAVGDLDDPGLDERAPQLADEERVAVGQVRRSPAASSGAPVPGVAFRGVAQELAATSSSESPARRRRTTSSERRRSASVCETVSGRSAAWCRGRSPAGVRARCRAARARWRRSRSVEASAQCPSSSTSSTGRWLLRPHEQLGHGGVQAVALGVRIGVDRCGQVADAGRLGRLAGAASSPPDVPQRDAQLGWVERRVWRYARAPRRTAHTAYAPPRRRRRRGRGRRPRPPRLANSRTRRLLPEPGLPPSRTTRRPSPSAIGMSARSVSSSDERPTNGNVEVRRREPGSSYIVDRARQRTR